MKIRSILLYLNPYILYAGKLQDNHILKAKSFHNLLFLMVRNLLWCIVLGQNKILD